jgi:hypothetical protein
MKNILNFLARHSAWVAACIGALFVLGPAIAEYRTVLLVVMLESIAIALSGLAQYAYTKQDFTSKQAGANLGFIFLGVHICVGLIVLSVYLVQYAN